MYVVTFVLSFVEMNPQLKHPFAAIIAGPSQSGKTELVMRLIRNVKHMIHPAPHKIIYCYGEFQPIFCDYPYVTFNEGLPDTNQFDGTHPTLLIIDDLMPETNYSISNIFTKCSHHRNVSVVYLTQNLFYKSKQNRTMNLNAHYIILFKNPRDATQVATLARQMYPGRSKFLLEAFKDATEKPHGYLLIDLKPDMPEMYRIRTNIFPDDFRHYVYIPK